MDRVGFIGEELADLLPDVLEPLPEPFAAWVMSGAWQTWQERLNTCWAREFPDGASSHHPIVGKLASVNHWRMRRVVDIGYGFHDGEGNTPILRLWRINDVVTLAWETPGPVLGEVPTWEQQSGQQALSVEAFVHEVDDFGVRLRADLETRLHEAKSLGVLMGEQAKSLERQVSEAFALPELTVQSDWRRLWQVISELEAWSGVKVDC